MGFAGDLVHHPRKLWLRRALFQMHLWAGVLLALYLIAIALSGSVLVFKDELTRWSLPPNLHGYHAGSTATPEAVVQAFVRAVPAGTITNLQMASPVLPAFLLEGRGPEGRPQRWLADPVTASLSAAPRTWLDTVHDFHYYLLLPPAWGIQVNAIGAAALLLLAATGMALWWPGLRVWSRGLRLNLRASWRRLNYDLHSASGFWTLTIVVWWAISGVYFGFYRQVTAAISVLSPLQGMAAPNASKLPSVDPHLTASLSEVLRAAQVSSPHGHLWSVSDPQRRGPESYVLLDLRAPGDFSHRDIVRVRTADARVISIWHYGERHTLSDWILWSMHPLHFGTLWGLAVKWLWALLGVALAVLTVTGLLMYWNRWLRHRWAALRRPALRQPAIRGPG